MKNLKISLFAVIALSLIGLKTFGQCCLTNNLVINTGYNPNTGTVVGIPPSVVDPEWTLTGLSGDCAGIAAGLGVTPAAYDVTLGPIVPGGAPTTSISFINSETYTGSATGVYWMTMTRCFYLCNAADVTFNFGLTCDDYVSDLNVNGTIPLGSPTFPQPAVLGEGFVAAYVNQTVSLPAGMNCINVTVQNFACNCLVGHSLDIVGTISTPSLTIKQETTACSGFTYCTEPAISGPANVCIGSTITLSDAYTGGTWSSGSTSIATITASTGVVTGVSAGTSMITYTDPCSREVTYTVTVQPVPTITGNLTICAITTSTLSSGTASGTWTSSNTSVVTIGLNTGIVYAVNSGTSVITFTSVYGCVATTTVTVPPTVLLGPTMVCVGSTISLSLADGSTGGTWGGGNLAIATVNSTGIVTGVGAGSVVITCISPITGCTEYGTVNVIATTLVLPAAVCSGTTLTGSPTGGTWTSSNTSVATIGSATGVVTAVGSGGTVTITYDYLGCPASQAITIDPVPLAIAGPTSVCAGSVITLSDPTGGAGVEWISSNTSIATIDATGNVTGVAAGTVTISYLIPPGGCAAIYTVTVNPLPGAVTGNTSLCVGNYTTLSDAVSPGTWSSNSTSVATINVSTGIVYGVSGGTSVITYSLTDGCGLTTATVTVTVNPLPDVITGATPVCAGSTITLSDYTPGGTWSSNNTAIATIVSGTGVTDGVSAGTTSITYTLGTGCFITTTITVNPLPGPIAGSTSVCVGSTTTLSDDMSGTWTSSNTGIAIIGSGTGVVTGVSTGTTIITYTLGTGCFTTLTITVNPLPDVITGTSTVCAGFTTILSDDITGGTWTSGNTSAATIGSGSGIMTGVAAGTTLISYTLGTGCFITTSVMVNPTPSIAGYVGACTGAIIVLSSDISGGTWTSSNTSVATVNPETGMGVGLTSGTTVISYTLPTGCAATLTVTVNATPDISGYDSVCVGSTINLSDDVAGGVWTSSNTSVAIVGSTGIVTGVMTGSTYITYTADGCSATSTVTVDTDLFFDFGGTRTIYPGCSTDVHANMTPIGATVTSLMWSSSNTSVATVSPVYSYTTTVTMAGSTGTSVVTLTGTNACGTFTQSVTVIAEPLPVVSIGGPVTLCAGNDVVLSSSPAYGTWTSSNTAAATINDLTGDVTGINPGGTSVITYTFEVAPSCPDLTATTTVTVNPQPGPVTGITSICAGTSVTLSDPMTGGEWASANTAIAVIGSSSGIVTGVGVGSTYITYTMSGGCYSTATITVNAVPAAHSIVGIDTFCIGTNIPLAGGFSSGTWSSSNTTIATVDGSGAVYGIGLGMAVITNIVTGGTCADTALDTVVVITVPAVPPITGDSIMCVGGTITLSDAITGGSWASNTTGIANIDPVTGVVTAGTSPGTAIIVYSVYNRCGTGVTAYAVHIIPTVPPITGVMAVCSGMVTQLSNIIGGGTWSTSNSAIALVDPTGGLVYGVATGIDTITYIGTSVCGTFTVSVPVSVNMPPYITTNYVVACQTLGSTEEFGHIINDSAGCIEVCQNKLIRYYGNGVAGSVFTWAVTGGTIVTNYGDSIDVIWPTAGVTGSITLYDAAGSCSGSYNVCILVITTPHASFTATEINVCLNGMVSFTNTSTADPIAPIVGYLWDFGDGGYSSDEDPTHTFSTVNPNDTVTLVVRNACGCTDTARMVLNIMGYTGLAISCPSIMCDSQSATYTISDTACEGSYQWSVNGGTIVSSTDSSSITVVWNNVSQDGYGYVNLVDPCAQCPDTNTIKIPVILETDTITGPDTVCTGNSYEYSLPLWAATQYMWGVLADHGAIVGYDNDYRVTLNFSTPGVYLLHGWYQNTVKLCGANLYKTIRVFPTVGISGSTLFCSDMTQTYSVGGLHAHWVLSNSTGGVVTTHSGTSFSYLFTTPGTYVLTATGNFCSEPLTIIVIPRVAPIDSMTGTDTVCLHRVYQYTAYLSAGVSASTLAWYAEGGTVSISSGVNMVNVIWNASGPKRLLVMAPNPCGLPDTAALNIVQEIINPVVTGDTLPCANSHRNYVTAYTRGEVYDWTITPNTAGSVVSGDHTTGVNVLWNNVTGSPLTAGVVLTVHKCDSVISDTLWVHVQPDSGITVSSSLNPACPGATDTFTASIGGISYTWNFGDGSPLVTTTSHIKTHTFPSNATTGNISYIVTVSALPDTSATCPAAGTGSIVEVVLPGPVVHTASSTSNGVCTGPALLLGSATSNAGTLTYQWYNYTAAISGATNINYTATTADNYELVATSSNGCRGNSYIEIDTCASGPGCGTVLTCTPTVSCNQITVTATPGSGSSPYWEAEQPTSSGPQTVSGTTATFTFDAPGIYSFAYFETASGGCKNTADTFATIEAVPDFIYSTKCAASGTASVTITDNSAYLPDWHIYYDSWSIPGVGTFTGPNVNLVLTAPGIYVVTEAVTFINTTTATYITCDVTHTLTLPAGAGALSAAFTYTVSTPVCSGIPITFTPGTTTGLLGYDWNFGDGSSSLLEYTQRTYTWGFPDPDPWFNAVTLTITDSLGCTAQTTNTVTVRENTMGGSFGPLTQTVCSPVAPVILTFASGAAPTPISYLWSTGSTSISIAVNTSGAYWVTVVGPYQCQATVTNPATEVTIIHMPPVSISGNTDYCYGQTVQLSGDVGSGVTYQWRINGALDGTGPTITDAGLAVGDYTYQLVITAIDSDATPITGLCPETASVVVHIYDQPLPPVITGPTMVTCSPYHLQLTATDALPGYYNWSDGSIGAIDDIYTGGFYEVWFTSLSGCKSLSSPVYVPQDPNISLQYFPTGCYDICRQQMPLTLYGPPDQVFNPWRWLFNGTSVSSGVGIMSPYAINSSGVYAWVLNNGLCEAHSGNMDVTTAGCNNCKVPLSARISCEYLNPASYKATITLYSPVAGTTYTIGTNMGPILPFSGTLAGAGAYNVTLTFTTLTLPPPATVIVEVLYDLPDGTQCFQKDTVTLPSCTWIPERTADTTTTDVTAPAVNTIASALLVFPNPATADVTISYDYGTQGGQSRMLTIYDELGRKVQSTLPPDVHGNWNLNTANWTPGVYIVRMEGDGQALQTQRVVVTH